jgi:DNA-directed RNA polymerase specialized sigma24 family protein
VSASRPPTFDVEHAERLAIASARGDEASFAALVALIWPDLSRSLKSSRRPAAGVPPDDGPQDVVLRMIEKMRHEEFRALKLYDDWRARHPEKSFADWLHIVAASVTRDHLRELRGYAASDASMPSPKQLLNAFSVIRSADELGARPPLTWTQTARELLGLARERLPEAQYQALSAWLLGSNVDEVAEGTGPGDDAAARRAVRAAIALLRREFTRR